MNKVERLAKEISVLSAAELAAFRKWFREYDAAEWDRQIEDDSASGKLDEMAEKALAEHWSGKTREI